MSSPEPERELKIWPCGCYSDRRVLSPDCFTLNMEVCSKCFDEGMEYLESLAAGENLELDLASQRERPKGG